MAKEFYTERDVEDLFRRGVRSLEVGDDVVLTELAYEKAAKLGVELSRAVPGAPPGAPVRPYLAQPVPQREPDAEKPCPCGATPPDLAERIRAAVTAKLGAPIDAALLDVIIARVLKSTGAR